MYIQLRKKKSSGYKATIYEQGIYLNRAIAETLQQYNFQYVHVYYKVEKNKLEVLLKKADREDANTWKIAYRNGSMAFLFIRELFRIAKNKNTTTTTVEISKDEVKLVFPLEE